MGHQPKIWIIVFDELKLIIFVSQCLTLSTASLVPFFFTIIFESFNKTLILNQLSKYFVAPLKVLPTFGQPVVLGGMFTQYQDMYLPGLSLWKPKEIFNIEIFYAQTQTQ